MYLSTVKGHGYRDIVKVDMNNDEKQPDTIPLPPAAPGHDPQQTPQPAPQYLPDQPPEPPKAQSNSIEHKPHPQSESPPQIETGPPHRSGWRELFSTLSILVTALLVALLIITFVFRSYQVDGPSMETTLQNNDKLIIWKVPRTWASITRHDYIPKRGDVIVFNESGLGQYGKEESKQLIKRVLGLPGDRVVVKDGKYTIYNAENPDGFNPDETLGYGKDIPTTSGNVDVTLDEHQLFVSGDNRPDSLDSRVFGPIDASQVVGKLVIRVFPLNSAEIF